MNEAFKQDWKRYKRSEWSRKCLFDLFKSQTMKYILSVRLSHSPNTPSKGCGGANRSIEDIKWDVKSDGNM